MFFYICSPYPVSPTGIFSASQGLLPPPGTEPKVINQVTSTPCTLFRLAPSGHNTYFYLLDYMAKMGHNITIEQGSGTLTRRGPGDGQGGRPPPGSGSQERAARRGAENAGSRGRQGGDKLDAKRDRSKEGIEMKIERFRDAALGRYYSPTATMKERMPEPFTWRLWTRRSGSRGTWPSGGMRRARGNTAGTWRRRSGSTCSPGDRQVETGRKARTAVRRLLMRPKKQAPRGRKGGNENE